MKSHHASEGHLPVQSRHIPQQSMTLIPKTSSKQTFWYIFNEFINGILSATFKKGYQRMKMRNGVNSEQAELRFLTIFFFLSVFLFNQFSLLPQQILSCHLLNFNNYHSFLVRLTKQQDLKMFILSPN